MGRFVHLHDVPGDLSPSRTVLSEQLPFESMFKTGSARRLSSEECGRCFHVSSEMTTGFHLHVLQDIVGSLQDIFRK